MKKLIFTFSILIMGISFANASSVSFINKKTQLNKTILIQAIQNTTSQHIAATFMFYDDCGQMLTVSVSCENCTGRQLGQYASEVAYDHTDSNGCFFL